MVWAKCRSSFPSRTVHKILSMYIMMYSEMYKNGKRGYVLNKININYHYYVMCDTLVYSKFYEVV